MHDLTALINRLRKQSKLRRKWAQRQGFEAYRVYEEDIPEFRFIVDIYGQHAVLYDKQRYDKLEASATDAETKTTSIADPNFFQDLLPAVADVLQIPLENLHAKRRQRMPGAQQYEKLAASNELIPVREESSTYLVNLNDFLDTGLFLDHRPLRSRLRKAGFVDTKPRKTCLNLFSYTGSISVAAAQGGYRVTSVDMSNTYLDWTKQNFRANNLDPKQHEFLRADALAFLKASPQRGESYDLIILDPPTFSNSKKMAGSFDVQRDHRALIEWTLSFLAPGGQLYFSTNRQRFRLDERLQEHAQITDISAETIPEDFRNQRIHRCFLFQDRG